MDPNHQAMAEKISEHLWDESIGTFSNLFSDNESFYERISPTSVYALQVCVSTSVYALEVCGVH
jgi:hypothetical protein